MYRSRPSRFHASRQRLLLVGVGLILGVLLALLPPKVSDPARAPVSTILTPAQRGLAAAGREGDHLLQRIHAQFAGMEEVADREIESQRLIEENQRLKAELQAARDQVRLLARRDPQYPSLLTAKCIPAQILGTPAQVYLARHHLLDAGRSHGVETGASVIRPGQPLVDRGQYAGVEEGTVVLAGSCVWGKITATGPHTSTVCPVNEPGYRDLVQLAVASADGNTLRFGAKGILEGTGEPLARLRMIETTEPVAVGDLVVSTAGQGFVEVPLLCGRVVRVERPHGAGHWDIWVAPAADDTPNDLAILCPAVQAVEVAQRQTEPQTVPSSE